MFVLSAAAFITMRVSSASPGVWMSVLLKCTWKPDTPARVPAGARISAGKSGNVLMSLPTKALVSVNCVPASCMPSPESPAKRTVTFSSVVTFFGLPLDEDDAAGSVVRLMCEHHSQEAAAARTPARRGRPLEKLVCVTAVEVRAQL